MGDLLDQPWFYWALTVVVGLPVLSIALTELNAHLVRRRSSMSGPVQMLRLYVLPLGALLVLLTQIPNSVISNDGAWVKIVATAFGLLVLIFILSGLNTALFLNATEGTWRQRMPSIFVDLGRIILIAAGLALLFSVVWGADVGGLFAALGVTSIVLGLALQNAVGSIIAGLLLLFEQPFQLGDWLQTDSVTGRVVEVNWRAIHIDTGNGITIMPNSSLAEAAFTNLSRPTVAYAETVATTFTVDDSPLEVIELLNEVASGLTYVSAGQEPTSASTGAGAYETVLPLDTYADAGPATAQFLTRLWFAARRRNLALDKADIWKGESTADVQLLLTRVARTLGLPVERLPELAPRMDIERYAEGETIERAGQPATAMRYIATGQVSLRLPVKGGELSVLSLHDGDYLGQTLLTRTAVDYSAVATTQVDTLVFPADVLDELVRGDHRLARELGRQLEQRREAIAEATAAPEVSRALRR